MVHTHPLDDAANDSSTSGIIATAREYIALTKPGIMALLLFTTISAMFGAARGVPDFGLLVITLLGGWMIAGGANAYNCVYDHDIDAIMPRTRKRGTANGKISVRNGFIFSTAMTIGGFLVLGFGANWVAAGFGLLGNFYYSYIYTVVLKRRTSQNIVIGGAAGAIPPLVGWAAVTGTVAAPAWILFAIIFYWTPPHFWSLALLKQGEYGRAGVPMLPNVRGEEETSRQIVLYTIMMVAASLLLPVFGMSWIYTIGAVAFGGYFIYLSLQLLMHPSKAAARRTFFYSIWYLAGVFLAMVVDSILLG